MIIAGNAVRAMPQSIDFMLSPFNKPPVPPVTYKATKMIATIANNGEKTFSQVVFYLILRCICFFHCLRVGQYRWCFWMIVM